MKKLSSIIAPCLIALRCIAGSDVLAQDVDVERIEERRSTAGGFFSNQCTVSFSVRNLGENLLQYVKVKQITKAVDSKGNTLLDSESAKWNYELVSNSSLRIDLLSPAREASHIKELSGTFSFFAPSEKNGSIHTIPKFTSASDKNLLPASASLKLTYLSPESIKKRGEELKKMRDEEMDKLDDAGRELAQGILAIFDGFTSWGDGYHELHFVTEGQTDQLIDIEFLNANGEKISTSGKSSSESQITYYFDTEPAKDWSIRILYETPKSVKNVPFNFKDLKLP